MHNFFQVFATAMDFLFSDKGVLLIAFVVLLATSIRVAQEYQRGVVFRLGRYVGERGPGLYLIIPLIERSVTIDIRTQTIECESQETITRDSVTLSLSAVLWYRIENASKSVVAVEDAADAVYQLALTSMRNLIGQHELDEILRERDKINALMLSTIAVMTAPWGITVERFEMKDVDLPPSMQEVMAMEAQAVREKRARLTKAEGEKQAAAMLADAAAMMATNPVSLELRRMQMISEVGAENNSTTILMIPADFVAAAKGLGEYLKDRSADR